MSRNWKKEETFDMLVFKRVPNLAFFVKAVLSSAFDIFCSSILEHRAVLVVGKRLRPPPFARLPMRHFGV
jgi:hypothetical protein